jgi:RNA recognition motif-containing protein
MGTEFSSLSSSASLESSSPSEPNSSPTEGQYMSTKLFVGNLSYETTSDEIRDLFSEVGAVESCQLISDRDTGRSKGFCFVEMNSKADADAAKDKFDGQELHGRALKVDEAKPKIFNHKNGGSGGRR